MLSEHVVERAFIARYRCVAAGRTEVAGRAHVSRGDVDRICNHGTTVAVVPRIAQTRGRVETVRVAVRTRVALDRLVRTCWAVGSRPTHASHDVEGTGAG